VCPPTASEDVGSVEMDGGAVRATVVDGGGGGSEERRRRRLGGGMIIIMVRGKIHLST